MLRVLLVDDNTDTTGSLALLLNLWGHDVLTANNGLSALDLIPSYHPDAVLLDISMPGMNGYEVARRLRALPGGKRSLLVAMAALSDEAFHRRAGEAGFDVYLPKPLWLEELKRLLDCCAKGRSARPGAHARAS